MKPEDCAYLAGVIDGEGCILIGKSIAKASPCGFNYRVIVEITMCEYDTIKYIHSIFCTRNMGIRTLRSGKTAYKTVWTNVHAAEIINLILPYLRGKRKQAIVALEFQKIVPGRGREYTQEFLIKAEELRTKIKWLKTAEALRC